jgi:hypothetical protein
VNDEEMAMEVIKSVGPGGEFISHEHTFQNFRKLSAPKLLDGITGKPGLNGARISSRNPTKRPESPGNLQA